MTRATCRNCGDPITKDERGWLHTRLPLKGGQPDTNPKPCRATPGGLRLAGYAWRATPGGRSVTTQHDLFEVIRDP